MKKLVSTVLALVMLMSALGTAAYAYDDIIFGEEDFAMPFTDLVEGAWYIEGIQYCYNMDIVSGMTETTFVPNGTLTRAQFVQMLAMFDGADLTMYKGLSCGFEDVKQDQWYNEAVCWAVSQGYVAGMSETRFGPNLPITREQLARLLYLYAETYGSDVSAGADLSGYTDADKVSEWAYEQVQWAVAAGIISGTSETTLSPRDTATRAQACRMIMTFDEFMIYGIRVTDGVYRAIADYVLANGTEDPEMSGLYEITQETDTAVYSLIYNVTEDVFSFDYYAEPYETIYEGEVYTDYYEYASLPVYSLQSEYMIFYYKGDESEENYIYSYSTVNKKGNITMLLECEGYEYDYADARSAQVVGSLIDFINTTVNSLDGYSMDDFYLPTDRNTSGTFKTIADHVMEKGTKDEYVDLYTYTVTYGQMECSIEYIDVLDVITIGYTEANDEKNEETDLIMIGLSEEHNYSFLYEDLTDLTSVWSDGIIRADGYEQNWISSDIDEDKATALERSALEKLKSCVDLLLSECGIGWSDLFVNV